MSAAAALSLAEVEKRLDHVFKDRLLLQTALTHASAASGADTYQRLEFLGDRVLGLVVAELLIAHFPEASEGELSRRLTALVRNESCAEVALALDLGKAVRLGSGEAQSGGRRKAAILGDVCEAVIGALHLDGGMAVARHFVTENWREKMLAWDGPLRDAKTMLQEWAQARGLGTPAYQIVSRDGPDHAPKFVVEVGAGAMDPGRGKGSSRREAEQNAAAAVLVREGIWKADS